MGEYEKAIEYLEQANNVFSKKLSSSLPPPGKNTNTETYFDHAFVLNNLGMCKRSSGDYDGSLKNYEQAYAIYAKYLGETHPNTKIVLENLEKTKQMSGIDKTRKKSVKLQPKLINKEDLVKVDTGNVAAQATSTSTTTSTDVTPVKLSKEEMARRKKEEEKQKKEEEKRKKLEEKQAKEEAKRKKKEDDRRIKEALTRAKEAEKKRVEEEKKKKKADEKARLEEEKRKKKEGKVSTAASSSKIQKSNENNGDREKEDVTRQALISKVESRTVDERDNENNNNFAKKGKKSKGCCF